MVPAKEILYTGSGRDLEFPKPKRVKRGPSHTCCFMGSCQIFSRVFHAQTLMFNRAHVVNLVTHMPILLGRVGPSGRLSSGGSWEVSPGTVGSAAPAPSVRGIFGTIQLRGQHEQRALVLLATCAAERPGHRFMKVNECTAKR